jgi:trehalose 6-phosphate phosphatase
VYESVSRSDNAATDDGVADERAVFDPLVQRVVRLLRRPRAGLITDIDGTISPIMARPEEAIVLPEAREALMGLKDALAMVAVVTGRGVADARAMVGVDGLIYVGNHGLEVWGTNGPELVPEARPWVPRLAAVLDEVARLVEAKSFTGVIIENKGATASLHYRLAPDPDATRRGLLEILARCAITSGLRLEEGRRVINLLPPLMVSKGSAVTWLAREHNLQRLVYLGDDVTDAHAFRALGVLRHASHLETLGIGVIGPETPPEIRQLADAAVPSVTAAAALLSGVLEGLKSSATMESRAPTVGST